jgi:pimeloyl-ACP methyl ester carboxylesterase
VNREPIEVRLYGAAGAVGNATAQVRTRSGNAAVVLLHGGPGAPSSVADLARELASDFHVLEPLQRRASVTPLTVQRHVDDLAAIAPDYAAIVGHSWGAMLALSYAARHPRRVRSLTLIGCGTYDADTRAAYRKAVERRLTPDDRAGIDEIGQQLAAVTDQTSRDRFFAEFGQIFNRVDSFDPLPHTPTSLSPDERGFNETWPDVLRLQESGIEPAAFSSIVAPTLMLHGDDDPHPGPAIRDTLIRHIPHLQYIELPRCGHHPWRERHAREPFLNALREWITQNSTGRQG